MNIHMANTEEYIDGVNSGALGEVLIRYAWYSHLAILPVYRLLCFQMQQRAMDRRCRGERLKRDY